MIQNITLKLLKRVKQHKKNLIKATYDQDLFDESLRSALTHMITGEVRVPKLLGEILSI